MPAQERLETPEYVLGTGGVVQMARLAPRQLTPPAVLLLQRLAGNRAVARLLQPVIQRQDQPPEWDPRYKTRRARPGGLTYEGYKAAIGQKGEAESYAPAIKAASEWGGRKLKSVPRILEELSAILKMEAGQKDEDGEPITEEKHQKRLSDALPRINEALITGEIDTVEAQSAFFAHMAGETGTLAYLEEQNAENRKYAPFWGRGTMHVTHEAGYVQALAYMEAMAEKLEKEAADEEARLSPPGAGAGSTAGGSEAGAAEPVENAAAATPHSEEDVIAWFNARAGPLQKRQRAQALRDAHAAIKGNIEEASNPRYSFLFSVAFMQMARGVKASANIGKYGPATFTGKGSEDFWVAGESATAAPAGSKDASSVASRSGIKKATYDRAVGVLGKPDMLAEPGTPAAATTQGSSGGAGTGGETPPTTPAPPP